MEELRAKINIKLELLREDNSAFNPAEIDEDDVWYENFTDPKWKGKVIYGYLSNYLIFLEKKKDGNYLSIVCETEPLMIKNDWLFGNPIMPSGLDYDFNTSIYDVASDYSHDAEKPVWEERL